MNARPWFVCAECGYVEQSSLRRLSFKCGDCLRVTSKWQHASEERARYSSDRIIERRSLALVARSDADALDALTRALDR